MLTVALLVWVPLITENIIILAQQLALLPLTAVTLDILWWGMQQEPARQTGPGLVLDQHAQVKYSMAIVCMDVYIPPHGQSGLFSWTTDECPGLANPPNGMVMVTGTTFGSGANYTCDINYYHSAGDLVRTCMEDLSWSGTAPTCTCEQQKL